MAPVKLEDVDALQEQIHKLEDEVLALRAGFTSLALALCERDSSLRDDLLRNLGSAGNQLEFDLHFLEPAKAIDELWTFLVGLLPQRSSGEKKS
jgi:hypothetical protein